MSDVYESLLNDPVWQTATRTDPVDQIPSPAAPSPSPSKQAAEPSASLAPLPEVDAPPPVLPSAPAPVPSPVAAPAPDPFADLSASINAPDPADPSIWNALPRGLNSVRQGANLSWFSAQRAAGLAPDPTGVLDSLAVGEEYDKLYPKTQGELDAERRFFQEGDWSELLNPRFVASAALESLPSMVGPLVGSVGGAVAGSLGGPAGTAAGLFAGGGAGSGIIDYGASYKEYLTKKLGPFDRAKWDAAFRSDPNLLDEAHAWAAKHSSMVAAFDMLGMKIGGRLAAPALAAGTSLGRRAAAVGAGVATEGVTETAGESTGTALASGGADWNVREAVLGGVAAAATGGAHSFIEPVMHKIQAGSGPNPTTDPHLEQVFRDFVGGPEIAPDPTGTPLTASATVEAPIWRSTLRDAVEAKGPSFATPEQWIATIRNQPGVKDEEIQYTGIEKFLLGQTGKISKSDVIAELEANQVLINEVENRDINFDEFSKLPEGAKYPQPPLYSKYTLPGGENYTELLLSLPETPGPFGPAAYDAANARMRELHTKYGDGWRLKATEAEQQEVSDLEARGEQRSPDYRSSHFRDSRNLLAHVRFNERVDNDGQRTLHLEEIQSDWHQEGRKEGYAKGGISKNQALRNYLAAGDAVSELHSEMQRTGRTPELTERLADARAAEEAAYTVYAQSQDSVPDAPFKSTWPELAFKRMLRYAADNGYSRITWTPAVEQIARYAQPPLQGVEIGLDAEQQKGMREFYDRILPSIAKKWAKRFGGEYGTTSYLIPGPNPDAILESRIVDVPYVDVPPAAMGIIQRGLPMFSKAPPGRDRLTMTPGMAEQTSQDSHLLEMGLAVEDLWPALQEMKKNFKLAIPLRLHMQVKPGGNYGEVFTNNEGGYTIVINLARHRSAGEVWATMTHELGHMVFFEHFDNAPAQTQLAIRAAYEKFRQETPMTDTMEAMFLRRDAALSNMFRQESGSGQIRLYQLDRDQQKYWASFDEWAAEQVVKWATTSAKPVTLVDRFFKGMGKYLAEVLRYAHEKWTKKGGNFLPELSVKTWLDSFTTDAPPLGATIYSDLDEKTKASNESALRDEAPYVRAAPQTFATAPARQAMSRLFGGNVPPAVSAMAAHGDSINKFTELMISLPQLAKVNTHIRSLQLYREDVALWQLEKQRMMDAALTTLKAWRKLRGPKADAVAGLIDDMMNMVYLPPGTAGRKPTQAEFQALVQKHNVDTDGLRVFSAIVKDFDTMLSNYEQLLLREAQRIVDPITRFQKEQDIAAQIARMRKTPYFPSMRFGNWTVTIRDANNKVIHFETAETQRKQKAIAQALKSQILPSDSISLGVLPKDARPLLGMPPGLLQMIGEKLSLSPSQKEVLEELRFELAPQQSFRHRFQRKRLVKGYSQNFMRAYANYFFHGSNHFARVKYADQLRDHVKDVREQAKFMPDGNNRGRIANFMSDHLQNILDPKPDFARLRGMMFMWALGYSPAAATLNLTQMIVGTYPFLASKFGDVKAMRAMGAAGGQISSFYKRGKFETLGQTQTGHQGLEMQALSEAVKEGVISEAMAPELAAVSEGRNLGQGFGGNLAERAFSRFSEGASWLFEMTEQTNRRITFRAAFNLALQNPNAPYIREVVATNSRQYDRLRTAGWTQQAAAAFVAAKDATESTQYQYSAAAQPRFMRGKLRTVFVFKSFLQNTLFFLWNYPAAAVRSILIMGFLGGLMGLPGAEDLKDILKVIGWRIFGKSFNLELEARRMVIDLAEGKIDPDILLHGVARKGFGIPAAVDIMSGGTINLPELDRSRAVSMGQINPVPLSPIFGPPSRDESRALADSIQKASGAAFGMGFNIIKAITDSQLDATDPKRWEKAMPRFLASISKGYRAYSEGQERTRTGSTVIRFDSNDPEQMMEVMAMAGGYTPTRLAKKWDLILAKMEVEQFWSLRKSGLLKQYYDAVTGRDPADAQRVLGAIRKYNAELPEGAEAMRITPSTVKRSIRTRTRAQQKREAGIPLQKSQIGLDRGIDRLFPGTEIDVRKVR